MNRRRRREAAKPRSFVNAWKTTCATCVTELKVDRLLLKAMGNGSPKGANIRRQSRSGFTQRVEDNAFHLILVRRRGSRVKLMGNEKLSRVPRAFAPHIAALG